MEQKLYVMKNEFDLIKIGISRNPGKRANEISNNSGVTTTLISEYETEKPAREIESILHKMFYELRVRGEWFKPEVLKFIGDNPVQIAVTELKNREKEAQQKVRKSEIRCKYSVEKYQKYYKTLSADGKKDFANRMGVAESYLDVIYNKEDAPDNEILNIIYKASYGHIDRMDFFPGAIK